MANIVRKFQKLFAGSALNNGQFGSKQLGTDIESSDPEVLQALSAYDNGWNDAVISGEELPPLEEIQGLQYKTDYQLYYLLQKGIPEWNSQTDYYIGDLSRPTADTKIYRSIADNNVGNALTDVSKWLLLGDLADLAIIQQATTTSLGYSYLPKRIIIANNNIDPNNDIDFNSGVFQFSDGSGQAALSSLLTKRLDANWASGTNQGGLDVGSKAINNWYYCYAIYNPSTLAEDAIFSLSPISPNLPSGYTKYTYVGAIRTNSAGNIIRFKQVGEYFEFLTNILDLDTTTSPTSPILLVVTVPQINNIIAKLNVWVSENNAINPAQFLLVHPNYTPTTPSATNWTMKWQTPGASQQSFSSQINVFTNLAGQILINSSNPEFLQIFTKGWIDNNI